MIIIKVSCLGNGGGEEEDSQGERRGWRVFVLDDLGCRRSKGSAGKGNPGVAVLIETCRLRAFDFLQSRKGGRQGMREMLPTPMTAQPKTTK